eukprot:PhF_6_TR23308/c0_g1_i4/m.32906
MGCGGSAANDRSKKYETSGNTATTSGGAATTQTNKAGGAGAAGGGAAAGGAAGKTGGGGTANSNTTSNTKGADNASGNNNNKMIKVVLTGSNIQVPYCTAHPPNSVAALAAIGNVEFPANIAGHKIGADGSFNTGIVSAQDTDRFKYTDFHLDEHYLSHIEKSSKKGPLNPSPLTHASSIETIPNPVVLEEKLEQGVEFCFMDFQMTLTSEHVDVRAMQKANYDITQLDKASLYRHMVKKRVFRDYSMRCLNGHKGRVKLVRIAPDDTQVLSCGHEDKIVVCTDLGLNQRVLSFSGHEDTLVDACWSQDCKTVVTASRDGLVVLWDALTAKKQNTIECSSLVIFIRFSTDMKHILMGFQDYRAVIYDAKTAQEKTVFTKHTAIVSSGAFSPDGQMVVTGSVVGEIFLWNPLTGVDKLQFNGQRSVVMSTSFSSDGNAVLTQDDRELHVWDPRSGIQVMTIPVE